MSQIAERAESWLIETVDMLLRMERTADPGTDEPRNIEVDLRTRTAIAVWLLDCRKEALRAALRGEEPKP